MKDRFEKLYKLQKNNLIYSPWAKGTSLTDRVKNIREEVDEAIVEIENKEYLKFKDEIGDVLWDCLGAIAKAENEGHFTIQDVLDHIYQKFTKRKPFILEERHVTIEEENEIWQQVKDGEKNE